jgi:hypothetical protein
MADPRRQSGAPHQRNLALAGFSPRAEAAERQRSRNSAAIDRARDTRSRADTVSRAATIGVGAVAAVDAMQYGTRAAQVATKQDPTLKLMSKQAAVLAAKTELGQNFKTKRDAVAALEWASKSSGQKALSAIGTGVNAVANNKVMMAAGRIAPAVWAANTLYRGFQGFQSDGARGAGRGIVEASIPFANKLGVLSFYDKVFGAKEPAGRPMVMEANAGGAALTTGDKTTNAIVTQANEGKVSNPLGAASAPSMKPAQADQGGNGFEAANKSFDAGKGAPKAPLDENVPESPQKRRGWSNLGSHRCRQGARRLRFHTPATPIRAQSPASP